MTEVSAHILLLRILRNPHKTRGICALLKPEFVRHIAYAAEISSDKIHDRMTESKVARYGLDDWGSTLVRCTYRFSYVHVRV